MQSQVLISDDRGIKDFRQVTFSGHSKAQVKKAFQQATELGQYEYAVHWAFELLCSGLVDTLWKLFFETCIAQVNRVNPVLLMYLHKRFDEFYPLRDAYEDNITSIRNSSSARHMVCEASALLTMSKKNKMTTFPTIKPQTDYTADRIREMAKAPLTSYANHIIKPGDPADILIAANEISFAVRRETQDKLSALYWIRWLLEWDKQLQRNKSVLTCAARPTNYVDPKHSSDVVWLIWECLNHEATSRTGGPTRLMQSLFFAYCYQWEPGSKQSRRDYMNMAVHALTDTLEYDEPLCKDKAFIRNLCGNTDAFFAEFKGHERELAGGS